MRCDDNNHQQRTTCGRMKRTFQTESEWIFFFFFTLNVFKSIYKLLGVLSDMSASVNTLLNAAQPKY